VLSAVGGTSRLHRDADGKAENGQPREPYSRDPGPVTEAKRLHVAASSAAWDALAELIGTVFAYVCAFDADWSGVMQKELAVRAWIHWRDLVGFALKGRKQLKRSPLCGGLS
jgi:hypothetical protein